MCDYYFGIIIHPLELRRANCVTTPAKTSASPETLRKVTRPPQLEQSYMSLQNNLRECDKVKTSIIKRFDWSHHQSSYPDSTYVQVLLQQSGCHTRHSQSAVAVYSLIDPERHPTKVKTPNTVRKRSWNRSGPKPK